MEENKPDFEVEIKQLKSQLNEVNAEKIALDQTYVESLRSVVVLRKEAVLLNQNIQNLAGELSGLKAEKESLLNQVKDLQSSLDVLKGSPNEAQLD